MSVLYLIPQRIGNFSAYMLGVVAAFLVMYVQDRRNIYQKIFLAVTFFSIRWLAVAMAGRMDDFITKALFFGNTIAGRQWLQYGLYAGTRILDIVLCTNEWYSRNMYIKGMPAYEHHRKTYGEQREFGYKDFIPLFCAERFDPASWMQ